jgi:pseudomonalisin
MSFTSATTLLLALSFAGLLCAQSSRPRINQRIDNSATARLARTTHPLAGRARDLGRASSTLQMDRILVQLAGSPEQDAELEQLIAEQHDPSSPRYQQWLTPEEFGERFGPAQSDVDAVTSWLESQGFQVNSVAPGRRSIDISGPVDAVERAFHTEMRHVEWNGEQHLANVRDIAIPRALVGIVKGVVSLHDFRSRTQHHGPDGGAPVPLANLANGSHAMGPYDFAAIYNLTTLWNQNFDGAGQSIAIAGRSNIRPTDAVAFRNTFGLPANPPQVILNGPDPGILNANEEFEADLDVQWSGAIAKGATVKFVVSKSSSATDGIDLSSQYIVTRNVAPVVSVSFGACEDDIGFNNIFYNSLWQQAAAQGQSVFVSSGDAGSAGCAAAWGAAATRGFGVNGLASSPYNVAVGGTQFADTTNPAGYWNTSNDAHQASARSYIPETAWNESSPSSPVAGGGGFSMFWSTPSWQTGTGVPTTDPGTTNGHHRYLPDVSLAAAGHDGYLVVRNGSLYVIAGTSASAPAFAGLMAIIDHYTNRRNGNPNVRLYPLAAQVPAAFHDVRTGSIAVPCLNGTPNCSNGLTTGFSAGVGYDLATGLGSVDAYALAANWSGPAAVPPVITSLSPNPLQPSDALQALSIFGTGFVSGAVVTASYPGYSVTLPSNSVGPNRIGTTITVGQTARTWTIKVTNPNGLSSSMQLVVPAPTPVINSLTPNPATVSSAAQWVAISGTGFEPGASVIVSYPSFSQKLSGSQISYSTPRLIYASVVAGMTPRTWNVQVVNASGNSSNTVALPVNAPPPTPAITSINPTSVPLSNTVQTVTINGTGFATSGARVQLTATGYTMQLPVISATGTQLKISMVPGTVARNYSVQVINGAGAGSNTATLVVR